MPSYCDAICKEIDADIFNSMLISRYFVIIFISIHLIDLIPSKELYYASLCYMFKETYTITETPFSLAQMQKQTKRFEIQS